jgi:putative transposase
VSRRFVSDHAGQFPVRRLCELVEISRSGYYEWSTRPLSQHYLDDVELAAEIHDTSRRTYGHPLSPPSCMTGDVITARNGRPADGQVRPRWRARPQEVAPWQATRAPAGDLLERDFTAERSDERWVADISEFRCRDGTLYLADIKDLHDRGMAGWSMGERQTTDFGLNCRCRGWSACARRPLRSFRAV